MIYNKYQFKIPEGKMIRVITDTDAKNEADDQFAIVHTLLSPRFDNRGFIAAHFGTHYIKNSMEESYKEIEKIFDIMKFDKHNMVFKGAEHALPDEFTPIRSEGAELIIREALSGDPKPLFVTFLGPLTDMASAYLLKPEIAKKLTVIWIGGAEYPAGGTEYNLGNDIHAANVVFKSDIPVWQVPRTALHKVMVSLAELEYRVGRCGEIGKYLFEQLDEHANIPAGMAPAFRTGECWCLGDSPVVGLMLYGHEFDYDWIPAPEFTKEMHYMLETGNRSIRVYRRIDTRFVMEDFYAKLALFAEKQK